MRRYLYYDEDSINSFLAQIERGLLKQKSQEKETGSLSTSQTDITTDITGDINAKALVVGASSYNQVVFVENPRFFPWYISVRRASVMDISMHQVLK